MKEKSNKFDLDSRGRSTISNDRKIIGLKTQQG